MPLHYHGGDPSRKLWGEFKNEKAPVPEVPDVTEDIEKSMSQFCLAEFDTEYDHIDLKVENLMLGNVNPLMSYAIELHKHANDMVDMINVAKLAMESNLIPPRDASLPIPKMPDIEQKHKLNNLNYMQKDVPPVDDFDVAVPEIGGTLAKEILSKCVATIFAHIGYETTYQSTLDILTDILVSFLQKVSSRLKIAKDDEQFHNVTGFPNTEERVLTELGLGGTKGIHDYYVTRIVKYIPILQQRCQDLIDEYEELLIQKGPFFEQLSTTDMVQVKVEKEDDTLVHFPDSENAHYNSDLLIAFEAESSLNEMEDGQTYAWCQQ